MSTIPALKTANHSDIRDKNTPDSIVPQNVSDRLDAIADELLARGIPRVADTVSLSTLNSNDATFVYVDGLGFFKDVATGVANGVTVFAGVGGRYWTKVYPTITQERSFSKNYAEESPILSDVPNAGVKDAIIPSVGVGALSTATNNKVGNFDQFVVTDGDNTSLLRLTQQKVSDNRAIYKMKVKIDAYRTNGALDCLLGIGTYGQLYTHDTGGVLYTVMSFNLTQKTIFFRNSSSNTFVDVTSSGYVSSGFAVANGDILEITFQKRPDTGRIYAHLLNTYTGEYMEVNLFVASSTRYFGLHSHHLSMQFTNGSATFLSHRVFASTPANPLLSVMGDSYGSGDSQTSTDMFPWLLLNDTVNFPYHVQVVGGNGGYLVSMAKHQLMDILKTRPKYVLLMSILSVFYGYYDDGGANQTEFDNNMGDILKAIVGYGGIPILPKWQSGNAGFLNNNGTTWNTWVTGILGTYPTAKVLDLTGEALVLSLSGHPTQADNIKIKDALLRFFRSEGVIL